MLSPLMHLVYYLLFYLLSVCLNLTRMNVGSLRAETKFVSFSTKSPGLSMVHRALQALNFVWSVLVFFLMNK